MNFDPNRGLSGLSKYKIYKDLNLNFKISNNYGLGHGSPPQIYTRPERAEHVCDANLF